MVLRPDIIVTKPDSPEILLVVEIKTNGFEIESAETALKRYMADTSCPVGMLVTADQTLFYRNRFNGVGPQAIDQIGECLTRELTSGALLRTASESDLEALIEEWLEGLPTAGGQSWPLSAREAIESSVIPVVIGGMVRAGGPRWRRAG